MTSEHAARTVDNVSRTIRRANQLVHFARIEVLRIRTIGHAQTMSASNLAHLALRQASEREQVTRKLVLRKPIEEVALVLG